MEHLGSYAKTAFPGARLGFAVADQLVQDGSGQVSMLARDLAKIKSMITVNTPSLTQAVIGGMLLSADGNLAELNADAAEYYRTALSTALTCLSAHFPERRAGPALVTWNEPSGGFS